jgi:hypothetical protein
MIASAWPYSALQRGYSMQIFSNKGKTHGTVGAIMTLCFVVLVLLTPAWGQEFRGSIAGTITDPTGAIVPGTIVTATGPQQTYTATTGNNGQFLIPFVQPATYSVKIMHQGFKTEERTNVIIDISTKINLNVVLQVGTNTETVTVSSQLSSLLSTEDASGGTIMDPEKVQQLPLNGRQAYMLLSLTPGVQFTTTTFGASGNSGTRGWDETNAYSVNGQSGSYNQFSLNGIPISRESGSSTGTWFIAPSIDAVEEFKVMSNTYDAQYGRYSGGTISTILKSGSRSYHGTLFDFWRNSVLDANTYQLNQVGSSRSFHNEHQFGGTVGGPVIPKKDKLFYFFSFEGWREIMPASVTTSVPTSDVKPDSSGNVNLDSYATALGITGIYNPSSYSCVTTGTSGCSKYQRAQFANNTIPKSMVSSFYSKLLALYPSPNLSGYENNYVYKGADVYSYNQPIVRVDYNISDKTKFFGSAAWWSGKENRNTNGIPGAGARGNIDNVRSSQTIALDLTHTFHPNMVGDVRVGYTRSYSRSPDGAVAAGEATLNASDLGLTMPSIPTTTNKWAPELTMDNIWANVIGNTGDPTILETYVLSPSMTHVIGHHNLHYGFDYQLYHAIVNGIGQPNGTFDFKSTFSKEYPNNSDNSGDGLADEVMGYPNSGSVQDKSSTYEQYKYYGAFVQDNWKITSKLAFNLGLRWDTETSPVDRNNHLLAGMCLTCKNPITDSITYPAGNTLANGATMANPMYGTAQFASSSLTAYENTWGSLQPKFGASYQLNRKLVVRGGYGISTAFGIELGGASPWSQSTSFNYSADGGITPTNYFNSGTPFPDGYTAAPGSSKGDLTFVGNTLSIDQRDRKLVKTQQYSFGFEAELPFHILGNIEYVGQHTTNLRTSRQLNGLSDSDVTKGLADASYLDQKVTNPFYGALDKSTSLGANSTIQAKYLMVPYPQFYGDFYVYTHADGYSNYNSMIAKAEKRMSNGKGLSNGLSFLSSFTWAKLMSATGYLNNSAKWKVDSKPSYHLDTGNNAPTWQLSFSGIYGLPVGRNSWLLANTNRVTSAIISDWQLEWIFQNRSGFAISTPSSYIYSGGTYDPTPAHKTWHSWLNNSTPSNWSSEPEYYTVAHNTTQTKVRTPWAQQTQLGLQKQIPLYRNMGLRFKVEAFNATNTPIFGSPSTSSPTKAPVRVSSVLDANQPGAYTGYGTVGSTEQNFPRQFQLSLKLLF